MREPRRILTLEPDEYRILLRCLIHAQFASTDCPFRMSGVGCSVEAVWGLG